MTGQKARKKRMGNAGSYNKGQLPYRGVPAAVPSCASFVFILAIVECAGSGAFTIDD